MQRLQTDWWREYQDFVKLVARSVARAYHGRVDYEELCQSGLLALVEAGRRFDPSREATFPAYVRLRVRYAVADAARRESRQKNYHRREPLGESPPGAPNPSARGSRRSPESEVMLSRFTRNLPAQLNALPAAERNAVLHCDFEHMTFRQAAGALGLSPAGVLRTRRRALERLRRAM